MSRRRRPTAIKHLDPFTVSEPWRAHVRRALAAHRAYHRAVAALADGPLRDRLARLGREVDTGVRTGWQLARQGQALTEAHRSLDATRIRRQLDELLRQGPLDEAPLDVGPVVRSTLHVTARQSLEAQLSSADHLDAAIVVVRRHLQVVEARLGEISARVVVLCAHATATSHWSPESATVELAALEAAVHEVERLGAVEVALPPDPLALGPP